MKVIETVGGFGASGGGVTTCLYSIVGGIVDQGIDISLITPKPKHERIFGNGERWIEGVENDCKPPFGYSRNISSILVGKQADIYHTHGLWLHINHLTAATARKKNHPYVISPHGMLYPEALHRSYWKKWPLIKLWFSKDIMHAAAMHATCRQEAETIRNFGYKGRIEIIPNPVEIPPYIDEILQREESLHDKSRCKIGYLGRIHQRKGIDNLLLGLSQAKYKKDVYLTIIGDGDPEYLRHLDNLVHRLSLGDNVEFAGYVDGMKKYELLASMSALFVPSDFENFGMIVPEALIVETPVMASLGTPWEMLNTEKCGWWADRDPQSIADIIDTVVTTPRSELHAMGVRGRRETIKRFSIETVAKQFIALYNSLK